MKLFKRFAAALLAGVMVLAMLTACGGGAGGGAPADEIGNKMVTAINVAEGTAYSNNADLQTKVRAVLSKVDENGMIAVADIPSATIGASTTIGMSDVSINETTGDVSYVQYMLYQSSITSDKVKAVEVTDSFLRAMENAQPGDTTFGDLAAEGLKIDALGVATYKASNGKTYIGMAIKVSGNLGDMPVDN